MLRMRAGKVNDSEDEDSRRAQRRDIRTLDYLPREENIYALLGLNSQGMASQLGSIAQRTNPSPSTAEPCPNTRMKTTTAGLWRLVIFLQFIISFSKGHSHSAYPGLDRQPAKCVKAILTSPEQSNTHLI